MNYCRVIIPRSSSSLVSAFLLSTCLTYALSITIQMLLVTSLNRSKNLFPHRHLQISSRIPHPSKSYWPPSPAWYHGLKAGPQYPEPNLPPNFLICLPFLTVRVKCRGEHRRGLLHTVVQGPLHGLWLEPLRKQGCVQKVKSCFHKQVLEKWPGAVLLCVQ